MHRAAIAIDPSNTEVVWVGTGENVSGRHVGWGSGVYKSRDGGATWHNVGLEASEHIGKILIHPGAGSTALVAAEDARFAGHLGIDPLAAISAMGDNISAGRVVRGASTITMQVAGMKLGHPRTWSGKAVEGFRALQLEALQALAEVVPRPAALPLPHLHLPLVPPHHHHPPVPLSPDHLVTLVYGPIRRTKPSRLCSDRPLDLVWEPSRYVYGPS